MNTKMFKGVGAAVSLFVGLGAASPVLATSTGGQALGGSAVATDVFTFTCPVFTFNAAANVADLIPPFNFPARMRVMLVKDGGADQAEDETEGGRASENAVLAKGPGLYHMMFFKTAGGAERYVGNVVCNRFFLPAFNPVLNRTQNQ